MKVLRINLTRMSASPSVDKSAIIAKLEQYQVIYKWTRLVMTSVQTTPTRVLRNEPAAATAAATSAFNANSTPLTVTTRKKTRPNTSTGFTNVEIDGDFFSPLFSPLEEVCGLCGNFSNLALQSQQSVDGSRRESRKSSTRSSIVCSPFAVPQELDFLDGSGSSSSSNSSSVSIQSKGNRQVTIPDDSHFSAASTSLPLPEAPLSRAVNDFVDIVNDDNEDDEFSSVIKRSRTVATSATTAARRRRIYISDDDDEEEEDKEKCDTSKLSAESNNSKVTEAKTNDKKNVNKSLLDLVLIDDEASDDDDDGDDEDDNSDDYEDDSFIVNDSDVSEQEEEEEDWSEEECDVNNDSEEFYEESASDSDGDNGDLSDIENLYPPPGPSLPRRDKDNKGSQRTGREEGGGGGKIKGKKRTNIIKGNAVATPPSTSKSLPKRMTKVQLQNLSQELYAKYNKKAFGSKLPADMPVMWSKRLLTTAGLTYCRQKRQSIPCKNSFVDLTVAAAAPTAGSVRSAAIDLSIKVLDNAQRLQNTLLHEMCHAAAWLIDGVRKPPHGSHFKKWAHAVMKHYPEVEITTCHSYDIHRPFKFQCSNAQCAHIYGRHSKNGIDITKQACGKCRCTLMYLGKFDNDGTAVKERKATAFSLFVKENFARVKSSAPKGASHGDIMRQLSELYKETTTAK